MTTNHQIYLFKNEANLRPFVTKSVSSANPMVSNLCKTEPIFTIDSRLRTLGLKKRDEPKLNIILTTIMPPRQLFIAPNSTKGYNIRLIQKDRMGLLISGFLSPETAKKLRKGIQ